MGQFGKGHFVVGQKNIYFFEPDEYERIEARCREENRRVIPSERGLEIGYLDFEGLYRRTGWIELKKYNCSKCNSSMDPKWGIHHSYCWECFDKEGW